MIKLKINTKIYIFIRYQLEKVIILLFSPIIIILFVAIYFYIKKYLKSNIIFKQKRPGVNSIPFTMYKFRTMDDKGRIIKELNSLRLHRLDEIPQFFNIMIGQMSLIGPRPEPMGYYLDIIKKYTEYPDRYIIKPGLTGFSQVYYKHTLNIDEAKIKLNYDMEYIKNINPFTDIKILFKTIFVILYKNGAE